MAGAKRDDEVSSLAAAALSLLPLREKVARSAGEGGVPHIPGASCQVRPSRSISATAADGPQTPAE